jgi:hypothetical protein
MISLFFTSFSEHFHLTDFRLVDAVFVRVVNAGYLLVSTRDFKSGHATDRVDGNTVAVDLIANRKLKSNGVLMFPRSL